mgnify:CR=1 FL=1|tara:strand:+ start:11453 stop:12592 length:1140 start_codon:yes stop_codon:yes gene_type:complete
MAQFGKKFQPNDQTMVTTNLHEAVPLTGTLMSGTYGTFPNGTNIRTYTHGMFESVYDYPYLSSSANHIFDLSVGGASDFTSSFSSLSTGSNRKRMNVYNSMAQILNGFDQNGTLRQFDENGDFTEGNKYNNVFFLNLSRLLYKDEVQKGTFSIKMYMSGAWDEVSEYLTYADYGAASDYRINSPAGEFGVLYVTEQTGTAITGRPTFPYLAAFGNTGSNGRSFAGLIFYQAGVVVLPISSSVGNDAFPTFTGSYNDHQYTGSFGTGSIAKIIMSGTTDDFAENFRQRILSIDFNNTTELQSSIYFCRAGHNEFNYSGNPSYLSSSKIVVKDNSTDTPVSYITTVGLYSPENELLAVAKLSEPLRKTPETEYVLRVRLDY